MATITSKVCDVSTDHGEAESVVFGLGSEFYTADLCEADAGKLTAALDPFTKVGMPISAKDALRTTGDANGFDPQVVRAWAQRQGKQLGDRGRIPADIVAEWRKATQS